MKRFFALAAILCVASATQAAPLLGKILAGPTNQPTSDPATGEAGPAVDIHFITVSNPNGTPVTSLGLNLPASPGTLLNLNNGNPDLTPTLFRANSNLPGPASARVAESFFVVPFPTGEILAVDTTDSNSLLAGSYTRQGGGSFIPANSGDVTVAVLTIPTGSAVPDFRGFSGNGAVTPAGATNAVLEPINFVPEPTTALLAALASVGFLARRK